MWELQKATPLGRVSMRNLLTFVAATFVTVFAYLILTAPSVAAQQAAWEEGALMYEGERYEGPSEPTDMYDLPDGSSVYSRRDGGTLYVIYFEQGQSRNEATTAQYVTYDFSEIGGLSNKSPPQEITIDPQSQDEVASDTDETSSCKVDGIGWIICPVTTFLAQGMDVIFDILAGFLEVRPLDTAGADDNVMLRTWEVMRNFANIAFVIAFLIIIYSQLTSIGLSNYGIKRLLPRLIVAAILVNVSYWVCAVAIDLSNILGYSLQDIFIYLRNTILGEDSNSWNLVSWQSVLEFALTGGAIAGGTAIWAGVTLASLGGSFSVVGIMLLLAPVLIGAVLTVLVVLFVLAARQALVTLLVIIAPLAFVAYLLPNTEKWFEKWRDLFFTLLLMFPAFSLIFGGSQLAGILIIQNADSINVVILGMAVQIAPLVITPLLFKLSGSLLGRIGGIINNPSKGILDRTKNWSKDRLDARRIHEMKKNRQMQTQGRLGRRNFLRSGALALDDMKRLRDGRKTIDEADTNALFTDTSSGRELHRAEHESHQLKEYLENKANIHLQQEVNMQGSKLHLDNVKLEASKLTLDRENKKTAGDIEEYKSGRKVLTGDLNQLMTGMKEDVLMSNIEEQRTQNAGNMQKKNIAEALSAETVAASALRKIAGGVDPAGYIRAQANAEVALNKIDDEALKNNVTLLSTQALNAGTSLKKYSESIFTRAINGEQIDKTIVKAAMQAQAQEGNMTIFEKARGTLNVNQQDVWEIIQNNIGTFKQKGGFHLQANPELSFEKLGNQYEEMLSVSHIGTLGDTAAEKIKDLKAGWIENVAHTINADIAAAKKNGKTEDLEKAYDNFHIAMSNPDILTQIGDRKKHVAKIRDAFKESGIRLITEERVEKSMEQD